MKHMTRLNKIAKMQAQKHPPVEWWIFTQGGEHDDMARSALTDELRPVATLPPEAHRIIITYDRVD